jgi:hypothetical protein
VYLSGIWDEIDGNEVCLIQFLTVHPEVFGVSKVSAPPCASPVLLKFLKRIQPISGT